MATTSNAPPIPPFPPLPPAPTRPHSNTSRAWAPSYKLSTIPKLKGTENNQSWREISQHILELYNCWGIVTGTELLPVEERNDDDELTNDDAIESFRDRYQWASAYFLETIDLKYLILLATHKTLPNIWKVFQDKFARENTSSFFEQLNAFSNTTYNVSVPIVGHIIS